MTKTTTTRTEQPCQPTDGLDNPIHPSDILLNLIVIFLAPMFLGASGGDIGFARLAAIETVNAYTARNNMDLVSVAQIIAFGLTALGSLSLSMADNLSVSMTLRLRGNAVSLNRASEQTRRALNKSLHGSEPLHHATLADELEVTREADHAALEADVAQALQQAADTQASLRATQPASGPAKPAVAIIPPSAISPATPPAATSSVVPPPVATTAVPMTGKQRNQVAWATTMANEAAKLTSSIASLPPAERKEASFRAAALASTANSLLTGINTPLSSTASFVGGIRPDMPPLQR